MKFPASITLGVRANSPRPRRCGGREGQELADAGARGGRQRRRALHAPPHPGHVQRQHHGQDGQARCLLGPAAKSSIYFLYSFVIYQFSLLDFPLSDYQILVQRMSRNFEWQTKDCAAYPYRTCLHLAAYFAHYQVSNCKWTTGHCSSLHALRNLIRNLCF